MSTRLTVAWEREAPEYDVAVVSQLGAMVVEIGEFAKGAAMSLDVLPDALPLVLVEFFKREDRGRRSVASLTVVLRDGEHRGLPAIDSSVRDEGGTRYRVQGRATVTVAGAPKFPTEVMDTVASLETLYRKARRVMDASFARWITEFKPRVVHPGVEWFILRRMTLKLPLPTADPADDDDDDEGGGGAETVEGAQVTADFFIEKHRYLVPVERDFMEYLYTHCAEVHGTTVADVERLLAAAAAAAVPTATELYLACRVMGMMLLAGALATYYTGDKAGQRDVERFSMGCFSREGQGDCEDDAQCVYIAFYWLRAADFFPGLKRLLSVYECGMCTGAATYAKLVSAPGPTEEFICHVWALLVPRPVLNDWLGERRFDVRDPLARAVKVMMMEGTASAPVFGLEKPFYLPPAEARREVERERAARALEKAVVAAVPELKEATIVRFKPEMEAPTRIGDLNDFYVYVVSMWIHNPGGPRCFHFERGGKIGTELFHVLRGSREVRLVAHDADVPFTDLERKFMVAPDTPVAPLVKLEDASSVTRGAVADRDRRAEFRFQREIPGLDARLQRISGYRGHTLRCIRIYEGCQLYVLEVFF